jgi:hypothetical protein
MMLPHRRDTLFRPKRPLPIGATRPKSAIFPRAEGRRSKKGEIFAPYTKKSVSLCGVLRWAMCKKGKNF